MKNSLSKNLPSFELRVIVLPDLELHSLSVELRKLFVQPIDELVRFLEPEKQKKMFEEN